MCLLIILSPFSPCTRTDDPDFRASVGKSYRHDLILDFANAESLLVITVFRVIQDQSLLIKKGILCLLKRNAMPLLITKILGIVPLE